MNTKQKNEWLIWCITIQNVGFSRFSHDISNSLATATGYFELFQLENDEEYAMKAHEAFKQLNWLVRSLSSLREEGEIFEALKLNDLQPFLEQTVGILSGSSGLRSRNTVKIADDLEIEIPRFVLTTILYPLVQNAIESVSASKKERGFISTGLEFLGHGESLKVVVSDNGLGWDSSLDLAGLGAHRVSTKGRERGNSLHQLGEILSRLGGTISFQSSKSGGARVELMLPLPKGVCLVKKG
tara:strand:+ start:409 stop:1131 length:723 start_codon:yes stop_codon:yes gene_type:complete